MIIIVQSVHQVIFIIISNITAIDVKDFVLHAQKQMFVRVAVQVDFSL